MSIGSALHKSMCKPLQIALSEILNRLNQDQIQFLKSAPNVLVPTFGSLTSKSENLTLMTCSGDERDLLTTAPYLQKVSFEANLN